MPSCVDCGSYIPDDQGSSVCSMCYGDIDHGRDGYYREWLERSLEEDARQQELGRLQWEEENRERN